MAQGSFGNPLVANSLAPRVKSVIGVSFVKVHIYTLNDVKKIQKKFHLYDFNECLTKIQYLNDAYLSRRNI